MKDGANTMVDFGFGGSVDVSASLPDGGYTLVASDADGTVPRSFIVDATPPGAPAVITPAEGAEYTVGQSVALSYFCSAGATCSPANGSAVDTSSPGGKTLTVTATDAAGNQTSVDVHYSVSSPPVDSAPPTGGSLSVPAATGSATITVTAGAASDPSGPITYALAQGTRPAPARTARRRPPDLVHARRRRRHQAAALWARDAPGNAARSRPPPSCSTAAAPAITIDHAGRRGDVPARLGQDRRLLRATTPSTRARRLRGTVPDGSPIDTGSPGAKSFTVVTATDDAGNSSSKTVTYRSGRHQADGAIETPKAQKYEVNTLVVADFSCADNGIVADLRGHGAQGDPIDTASSASTSSPCRPPTTRATPTTKTVRLRGGRHHGPDSRPAWSRRRTTRSPTSCGPG